MYTKTSVQETNKEKNIGKLLRFWKESSVRDVFIQLNRTPDSKRPPAKWTIFHPPTLKPLPVFSGVGSKRERTDIRQSGE